ncbi:hypothetical protein V2J09_002509 [Rumex salicifolius]
MVWFQCEDCGENLKKPKLVGHFRMCSAFKLSCIDCGQVFGQQAVQGHTQCISEAEKYGPKGLVNVANGTPAKASSAKKNADVDIHVGLSNRPPWFCSLCNTSATSQQTLLLHADGKKHRAKARAFHAANQPKPTEESNAADVALADKCLSNSAPENNDAKEEPQKPAKAASNDDIPVSENGNLSVKKRKTDDSVVAKCTGGDVQTQLGNGEVVQIEKEVDEKRKKVKKAKHDEQENGEHESCPASEKIKWKKLLSSILKSTPDGAVKMKKLQKLVRKSLQESGISFDVTELSSTLENKVKSSSRLAVDGKYHQQHQPVSLKQEESEFQDPVYLDTEACNIARQWQPFPQLQPMANPRLQYPTYTARSCSPLHSPLQDVAWLEVAVDDGFWLEAV